ncbi:MAG: L,D-transpeptidase [Hyphomicrobiales bacterium]|nr:MAG: L,D-transpeptidase [Hyphomicrobiales bacterium]
MLFKRLLIALALVITSMTFSPFLSGDAEARKVFDPSSRTYREIGPGARHGKSKIKRKVVKYATKRPIGTIIVNTKERRLYHVLGKGKAMRYGIGVGREGFQWSGTHRVSRKAEWPGWTPPAAMRRRQPGLPKYMPGGINNPLGARALYIGSTIYRIHGSNAPWTIGGAVSSGCIRMTNKDVEHLYERVKIGAKVVVVR